ncbi:hypothetical protein B9Q01_02310 [Candidatus Marsarchaeota G1 archaeon OSP_D]|uniref:Uncharacterized protein n=2 Tax=Candidatus Marsarchaeota group 1 TaxID=2203770 RepID=A0A2R6ACM3_9ARCH|nr:MAG: hypothetical protein B9Q01_02310 [Candidatus Marsarchaeota G1 archaeon OSP_D]PSN89037.1 MAG: hypothetical protein B9Q00_03000 [Candidatus Marsarchaeota G1 archaeon OSP_C]
MKRMAKEVTELTHSLSWVFLFVFLLQIIFQQLFLRLAPYLFASGIAPILVDFSKVATVATDTATIVGLVTLVAIGVSAGKHGHTRAISVPVFFFVTLLVVMDFLRATLPVSLFSSIYGSTIWYAFSLSLYIFLAILVILAYPLVTKTKNTLFKASAFALTAAINIMSVFELYLRVFATTSYLFVGVVYNLVLNLLGLSVVLLVLECLISTFKVYKALTLSFSTFFVFLFGYKLYTSVFWQKIFELTWETSFGTPLPLPQGLVYALFLLTGVFLTMLKSVKRSLKISLFSLIVISSSMFLMSSLTLYVEAVFLGYLLFLLEGITQL